MTPRSKLCAKVAAKLDSGRKFIIPRTETGQPTTLNTCQVATPLVQTGFKCTQSWRNSGKSMENNTAPKRNTLLLNQSPSVRLAKKQVK